MTNRYRYVCMPVVLYLKQQKWGSDICNANITCLGVIPVLVQLSKKEKMVEHQIYSFGHQCKVILLCI